MTEEVLAYLDHNILDSIRKGDPFDIRGLLDKNKITPIYSKENLKEIKRSVGSENEFLSILKDLGAKYIEPIYENNLPAGKAHINDSDVYFVWRWFIENDEPMPEYGYGLSSMLEKFYGGRRDETYAEIFSKGDAELKKIMDDAIRELDSNECFTDEMKKVISSLPEMLVAQHQYISEKMDILEQSPVKAFENATGLGAKVLKNIHPPQVVQKIFKAVQGSIPNVELDIDVFFGVKCQPFEANSDRVKTLSEKVNGLYHQLNFLGYYRDTDMKNTRGFVRSSSDMTHAGIASFCHLLLCRDEGLVKKAAAAYEYAGVRTLIIHFQANKA
ncbi:hypothetical protein KV201_18855 [Shewanella sp. SR1]|uniref:hypothetical protein n=1 Tax=Shewanella sp. SR1 TaxID=2855505 RepID=UPI000B3470B8|nr:hypothetical protein [Shewanella sp. SR1]MCB2384221.1 hypothetical protein [Shewanella sp. SR1]QXN27241.1 hypothetical protein KVP08_022380 [Shewanella putrefaciens]